MAISNEAQLLWLKALSNLSNASAVTASGFIINQSYWAMRNAAVAVLLAEKGVAPTDAADIVAAFGAAVGQSGFVHGQAFNRAADLLNVENYDIAVPSLAEATTVCADAKSLMQYCATAFGFDIDATPAPP